MYHTIGLECSHLEVSIFLTYVHSHHLLQEVEHPLKMTRRKCLNENLSTAVVMSLLLATLGPADGVVNNFNGAEEGEDVGVAALKNNKTINVDKPGE